MAQDVASELRELLERIGRIATRLPGEQEFYEVGTAVLAELEGLKAERDRLRGEVSDLLAGADADAFNIGALTAENGRLREALEEYAARHGCTDGDAARNALFPAGWVFDADVPGYARAAYSSSPFRHPA